MTEEEWKKVSVIHIRVTNVLRQWMKDHWEDFTPSLVDTLKAFVDNSMRLSSVELMRTLTQTLNAKVSPPFSSTSGRVYT